MEIIDALLDPLSLFGLMLFAVALVQLFRWRRGFWVWPWVMVLFLALISAPAIVNPLLVRYETLYPATPCSEDSQLPIVLLGGGLDGRATSAQQIDYLHPAGYRRTIKAAELALADPDAVVYVSGGLYRQVAEAEVMSELLRRLGVSEAQLRLEVRSTNTFENALQVKEMLQVGEARQPKVRLVTSAVHMPRAAASFKKAGLDVCPVPAEYLGLKNVPITAMLPQSSALRKTAAFWHELIGWVYYKLAGRL